MGRVVLGVVVCWLASPSTTAADTSTTSTTAPEPIPMPAPAETSWYATTPPASPSSFPALGEHSRRTLAVNRSGAFALGGITHVNDSNFGRIDVGVPVPTRTAPRLRALVSLEFRYETEGTGSQATSTGDLAVIPEVQYDWRLPFESQVGDVVVVAGAGLSRAKRWVRLPDEPFWPSTWESTTAYALRLDLAVQYRGRRGLIVSLQPLGIGVPLNRPEPPDARWMSEDPAKSYAISLAVGYQLP